MVKQVLQHFIAAVVSTVRTHGLGIKACCRNQPNKSQLVLCKPLYFHFSYHINYCMYINSKTKCFSIDCCCICGHCASSIKAFKKRMDLGYRKIVSGYYCSNIFWNKNFEFKKDWRLITTTKTKETRSSS